MSATKPDIIVYVCQNCIPREARLPVQWSQEGSHVVVRHAPCTGKIDASYLFRALEGGLDGACVVACPKGDCKLSQGNFRAEMRLRTARKLLGEIGMEPERIALLHAGPDDPPEPFEALVRQAVAEIGRLGPSPIRTAPGPEANPIAAASPAAKGH